MREDLIIARNLKKSIIYIDKIVANFPNTEKVLKDNIMKTLYDILELIYFTNELNPLERNLYQKKIISKLKMIDFYFKISVDKKYISYKKYNKVGLHLSGIVKSIYGWIKYEKIQ